MPIKSDTRLKLCLAGAKPEAQRFSNILAVETVPDTGLDVKIGTSESERRILAAQCGILSVQSFEAAFHIRKQGGRGRFHVSGNLQARVTQISRLLTEQRAYQQRSIDQVRTGNVEQAVAAFNTDASVPLTRQIRQTAAAMRTEEARLLIERDARLQRSQQIFYVVLTVAGVLIVLVAATTLTVLLRYTRNLNS